MSSQETLIPRTIFGLAAVTMTACTLAVLVFLPAEVDASDDLGAVSNVLTAATAGASAIAESSDLDSLRKAASAVFCTTVKSEHPEHT